MRVHYLVPLIVPGGGVNTNVCKLSLQNGKQRVGREKLVESTWSIASTTSFFLILPIFRDNFLSRYHGGRPPGDPRSTGHGTRHRSILVLTPAKILPYTRATTSK